MKQKVFLLLALWVGGLLRPPFEQLQSYAHAEEDFAIDSLNDPDAISDFQTAVSLEQPLFAPTITIGLDMAETAVASSEASTIIPEAAK